MTGGMALLARQPIYDAQLKIVAYELLFRGGEENRADFSDADSATSQVILNAFTELPVGDVLDGKPAYINFTRKLLDSPPPIDCRQVVVEVLEDIQIDDDMLKAVACLKKVGYTIALDDYIFNPAHHQLLQMTDIVKLDVLKISLEEARKQIHLMSAYSLQFLAEKIETHTVFTECKKMGFSFFQGYFLAKPQIVRGKKIDSNQQSVLKLFGVLQNAEVNFDDIERVICVDPVLSFKLLRLVNSAMFGLRNPVDSIQLAISLLGISKVRSWASLLSMASQSDKSQALCLNSMVRAHMVELLGNRISCDGFTSDRLFGAGLISTLDAFLDISLEEVADHLILAQDMRDVILQHKNTPGLLLDTAINFEQARLGNVNWSGLASIGLESDVIEQDYLESVLWADKNVKGLF
ncbi:MAG: HDOD domain-containing protein [Spongiibacteraceae bacterium]|nr:HDOD domain-containing protein [Spongiibacteraceae bacterium]